MMHGPINIRINLKHFHVTILAVGKQKYITYSECVFVAIGIQRAKRMRRFTSSSVACQAVTYFASSHKVQDFLKEQH